MLGVAGSFHCAVLPTSNAALSDAIYAEAAMPTNERIKADLYVVPSNETVIILPVIPTVAVLAREKPKLPPAAAAAVV